MTPRQQRADSGLSHVCRQLGLVLSVVVFFLSPFKFHRLLEVQTKSFQTLADIRVHTKAGWNSAGFVLKFVKCLTSAFELKAAL